MIEFINAVNGIGWPGAMVVSCTVLAIGAVGYAIFRD